MPRSSFPASRQAQRGGAAASRHGLTQVRLAELTGDWVEKLGWLRMGLGVSACLAAPPLAAFWPGAWFHGAPVVYPATATKALPVWQSSASFFQVQHHFSKCNILAAGKLTI